MQVAVLSVVLMLAHDTKGHDWQAAAKLSFVELLIFIGLDESEPVQYRNADGVVETTSRIGLKYSLEPRSARSFILHTVRESAAVGGLYGFGGALACLLLTRWPRHDRRYREFAGLDARSRQVPRPGFLSEYESPHATHAPPASARIGEPAAAPRIAADPGHAKIPPQAKRKRRRKKPGRWV